MLNAAASLQMPPHTNSLAETALYDALMRDGCLIIPEAVPGATARALHAELEP